MFYLVAKRILDICVSGAALIVLSPVFGIVALLIARKLGRPILFKQIRPGLHGRPFQMLKFRSMSDTKGADGKLLPDVERLTPFGKWLRSTSLDELPGLWSVFKGDMSLVGPRPLLMRYLELYTPDQARRHDVKPGWTGWTQVNGRNALSWEQKFAYDNWYVDNRSLWLDLKIIFLTAWKVVKRDGISAEGEATMPEFMGSRRNGE